MNGYIEVVIKDRETGLRFGFPAIKWFSAESVDNKDAFFMPGETFDFSVEGFAKLMQCAYRNSCLVKEIKPVLKYADFIDWVEQATKEQQLEVIQCYADSSVMKKAVAEVEEKKSPIAETESQSTLISSNQSAPESLE